MSLKKNEIEQLVSSPSLGAVVYQANVLIEQLNPITEEEFLPEACIIREILLCYAERCRDELLKLYPDDGEFRFQPKGGPWGARRVRVLGNAIRELYSYVRYLLASSPRQAPPALQVALRQLRELYFPRELGTSICVVRPQWKYNLEYVPLSTKLRKVVAPSVLDPDGGLASSEDIILPWWLRRRKKRGDGRFVGKTPPQQLAILSFAGLDTNDSLCFPLLAHELGHFIAFNDRYAEDLRKEVGEISKIRLDEVCTVVKGFTVLSPAELINKRTKLANQVSVCQREVLADLLATRMMGLSFFFAQAEYLKTMAPWSQPRILSTGHPEGYPGIRFRLWSILRHLLKVHPNNPCSFLDYNKENPDANTLRDYLDEWSTTLRIQDSNPPKGIEQSEEGRKLENELARIVETKVLNSLVGITKVAQHIVPDDVCAKLSPLFFERVLKLAKNLPPSCTEENSHSFGEIMSAAWAYQVLYGEDKEAKKSRNDEKYKEYNKTCDLILKAIELIPAAQAINRRKLPSKNTQSEEWLDARGVLSKEHIINRIKLPVPHPSHLAILPLNLEAINGASLDVHLGNWFSYARRTKLNSVAINDPNQKALLSTIGREEAFVPIGRHFLLHPGDLVLGATQEFVGLPTDIMAFVEGKSGLGRLGLFVATATQVAPGFHGVIVLELANAGTVPLDLSPGMAIAQLVFQTMTERTSEYGGGSSCQIKP